MLTTLQLKAQPIDGTVFVGYGDLDFQYWGMTEQDNGDMLVHLEYADAGGERKDVEVAAVDLRELIWES